VSDVHERLRRLLFLVPYVSKHQGITVDALAAGLGVAKEELLDELDLLTFVGRPPFQPDDFIDIYVENDQVYVDLDQRLSAPPRLTVSEAVALSAAASLLRPAAEGALASALAKLEKVLPAAVRERYRRMGQKIDAELGGAPVELAPVTTAIAEHRELELEYFSHGRNASEARSVKPLDLFSRDGQWYLYAYCNSRQDERLFRLDRAQNLRVTERSFAPMPGSRGAVPNPAAASRAEVRVRCSAAIAPYVRERFGSEARPLEDGGVEVRVAGDSERWLTQWVLSLGGEAEVIEPEWAREAVARAAAASLES
jgi:proteasome accessory factor C